MGQHLSFGLGLEGIVYITGHSLLAKRLGLSFASGLGCLGLTVTVSLKHDGPTGQTTGQRKSDPSALLQAN